ncbi:MAG: hypothetical protein SVW02_00720 [Candidatus Nanohaloarchaea archaeon]|nr:hypothetical protein [Candidatus Nanohaloarchaea archaeon]
MQDDHLDISLDDPVDPLPDQEVDLTDEETVEALQERDHDPMDTETDEHLLFGHSILHGWVEGEGDEGGDPEVDEEATDWEPELIEEEHERLVDVMEERGIEHDTPMGDL